MVEDLFTETYLVDTALNHLIRAGKLEKAKGFVFGTNVDLKNAHRARGGRVECSRWRRSSTS